MRAAAEILTEKGLEALTLRAIARRAGVSHMAPAHHFGDLSGLLSELAAHGYQLFGTRLQEAQRSPGKRSLPRATAQAYVAFARENVGLFLLMFRSERLDFTRPSLAAAAEGASQALMRTAGGAGPSAMARAVFDWSVVHGFAMLLIDGRLDFVMAEQSCTSETLLDDALAAAFSMPSAT